MQKGKIGVTTENIFPIIKKFLYSDHEIFLRELISNAVDATQKLRTLSSVGEYKGELGDQTINIKIDKEAGTLTISDKGVGMTSDEIDKYINQIAFSGAEEFLDKYKTDAHAIIGHFGLGFYSSFMVSNKVEVLTKSFKEGSQAVKWSCDGSPEFELENIEKDTFGTDIVLFIDDDSKEFLEDNRVNELLNKYCKFLPVEIAFGNKKDWKDGKEVETEELNIINNTKPAWTLKPADLKDEDYNNFYHELYPMSEDPLFNIHLNVDYPFNLTGILYFPKLKSNVEVQKNKIQLYSNQVFVTDSVEGIVPEFLTLLHGVIDSPDIPLNVSRSYLQSDRNVKKISSHITKKVADRLSDIFKSDRKQFEEKWDDLSVFIKYGMLTEEKFFEKAQKFSLFKNTDNKYFTFEEYNALVKENQTDKEGNLIYLYSTNLEEQHSFIDNATNKGYDVIALDGQLDSHIVNHLEQKFEKTRFVRVDADVVDKLIQKDEKFDSKLSDDDQNELRPAFNSHLNRKENFAVVFEAMREDAEPIVITQSEFMRRMKDMSATQQGMSMYGDLPDSYNLVVNSNHPLIIKIREEQKTSVGGDVSVINDEIKPLEAEKIELEKANEGKKDEEITQAEKDAIQDVESKIKTAADKKDVILSEYGKSNKLVKQLIDLALISNNMLKGEELTKFVKRSIELIK